MAGDIGGGVVTRWVLMALCLLVHTGFVLAEGANPDPWEKMNRRIQGLNEWVDRIVFKPAATVYRRVVPVPVRRAVGNCFGNLADVNDGLNNLLQGKFKEGSTDFQRVFINTTLGIGGLFDPASRLGLEDHDEDFGQTLAKWGLPRGPYLVVPFVGPTTVRDLFSRPIGAEVDPVRHLDPVRHRNLVYGTRLLHERGDLFAAESVIFGDRYLFIRDAYLQRRDFQINDGDIEDIFTDEYDEY